MKKVVVIHGSPKKRNTYDLVKQVEALLIDDAVFEYIDLYTKDESGPDYSFTLKACKCCNTCVLMGRDCVVKDSLSDMLDTIDKADGVIITSPLHTHHVSAGVKLFYDRLISYMHRPRETFVGKPLLTVTTTMGYPYKEVLDFMREISIALGLFPTDELGRDRFNLDEPVKEEEIAKFKKYLFMNREDHKPTLKQVLAFNIQKHLAFNVLSNSRQSWIDRGWDKRLFYYDCRINPLNKTIAKFMYKKVSKRGVPVENSFLRRNIE